jgi:hypothetical protein
MMKFHIEGDDISDGYHTFGELYAHRCALFVRLCMTMPDKCAWKRDESMPGWIILYCELEGDGQISYHVPNKYMKKLLVNKIWENPDYKWDGHTSHEVLDRLEGV